jgi:hypothetical protein
MSARNVPSHANARPLMLLMLLMPLVENAW